jgi:hypothetical protein
MVKRKKLQISSDWVLARSDGRSEEGVKMRSVRWNYL